jgi:hypothetical protein
MNNFTKKMMKTGTKIFFYLSVALTAIQVTAVLALSILVLSRGESILIIPPMLLGVLIMLYINKTFYNVMRVMEKLS